VSGYLVTVTTTKRRDRGRKTIELKTFEYDEPNQRWIYHPGRLTKKLDGTGANVDDVISAMLSQDHGRLVGNGQCGVSATQRCRSRSRMSFSTLSATLAATRLTSTM
jgi:hypothetical protein